VIIPLDVDRLPVGAWLEFPIVDVSTYEKHWRLHDKLAREKWGRA
jgi:hypothetical protein